MQHSIPAHAADPPVDRDDPLYASVVDIGSHGRAEEVELISELSEFLSAREQPISVRRSIFRDGDTYLVVTIGVGIATNLLTDFIKFIARRLRERLKANRAVRVYISPSYAPKPVFVLPDDLEEVLKHFGKHPSADDDSPKS